MNYHLVSLGCAKNLVDSEIMMGRLRAHGYERTLDPAAAHVIIVNTCAFVRSAKEESIDTVLDLARYKTDGACRLLVVTGCLPQRYRAELPREMPEVDAWIGTDEFPRIAEILDRSLQGEAVAAFSESRLDYEQAMDRALTTPQHWAWLKISEGCNHACHFCVIPTIRGRLRSRSMESVVQEAKTLADGGARELVLIAQDITDYGRDRYGRRALPELLDRLADVEGVEWLRIMYAYPTSVDEALIEVMARNPRVCKYLDIPLQHASTPILRAMGRPGDAAHYRDLIARFRDRVPGIAVRSTFIVGYPGETEREFDELLAFLDAVRFDRAGFFTYSNEEGTPAAALSGRVARRERQRRFRVAYRTQQRISHAINASRVGQTLRVLVDAAVAPEAEGFPDRPRTGAPTPSLTSGASPDAGIRPSSVQFPPRARYLGRTEWDAPEIDGTVFVNGDAGPGQFVRVRVTGAHPYDLVGTVV